MKYNTLFLFLWLFLVIGEYLKMKPAIVPNLSFDTTNIPFNDHSDIIISIRSRQSSHNNLNEFAAETDHLNSLSQAAQRYNSFSGYGSVDLANKSVDSPSSKGTSSKTFNEIQNFQTSTERLSASTGSEQQHSVLYNLRGYTIPFVIILYLILQSAAGYFNDICTEPYQLAEWVRHVHFATIAWFILHILYNIYHMSLETNWKSSEAFYAYAHGLCILFIVLSSTVLSVTQHTPWTTLCRDGFG